MAGSSEKSASNNRGSRQSKMAGMVEKDEEPVSNGRTVTGVYHKIHQITIIEDKKMTPTTRSN